MAKQTPGDIAAVIIWLLIDYIKKPAEFLQLLKNPISTWLKWPSYFELPLSRVSVSPANRGAACPWQAKTCSKVQIVEFPK